MGRAVHKVPAEFNNLPLNERWSGYDNPYTEFAVECSQCDGAGYSPEYRVLEALWYGYLQGDIPARLANVKTKSARDKLSSFIAEVHSRPIRNRNGWMYRLNEGEVNALWERNRLRWDFDEKPTVNDWSQVGMGHDSLNAWLVIGFVLEGLGLHDACQSCDGHGDHYPSPQLREFADKWEYPKVPTGDYYQFWSTTIDGPISPAFATKEELAEYISTNNLGFGGSYIPYDDAMTFIAMADQNEDGEAHSWSMVVPSDRGIEDGLTFAVDTSELNAADSVEKAAKVIRDYEDNE